METKIFKQIQNHPSYYISNQGEVLSYKYNKENGRILKPLYNQCGYQKVSLDGKQYFIHRLVAEAFIPNPYNLETVNHKNHIKTDNRVENLEWMTLADNVRDANANTYRIYSTKGGFIRECIGMQAVSDFLSLDKQKLYNLFYKNKVGNRDLAIYEDYIIHREKNIVRQEV